MCLPVSCFARQTACQVAGTSDLTLSENVCVDGPGMGVKMAVMIARENTAGEPLLTKTLNCFFCGARNNIAVVLQPGSESNIRLELVFKLAALVQSLSCTMPVFLHHHSVG